MNDNLIKKLKKIGGWHDFTWHEILLNIVLFKGAGIVILVAIFFYGEKYFEYATKDRMLAYALSDENRIIAFNAEGEEVWNFILPEPVSNCQLVTDNRDPNKQYVVFSQFTDPASPVLHGDIRAKVTVCKTADSFWDRFLGHGQILWTGYFNSPLSATPDAHYIVSQLLPVKKKGKLCLAVSYVDTWQYPSIIRLYDLETGDTVGSYAHPGRDMHMAITRFEDEPEKEFILCNCPNNDLRPFMKLFGIRNMIENDDPETLFLLNPDSLWGVAPSSSLVKKDTTVGSNMKSYGSELWYGVFAMNKGSLQRATMLQCVDGDKAGFPLEPTIIRCELTDGRWFIINKQGNEKYDSFSTTNDEPSGNNRTFKLISSNGEYCFEEEKQQ